MSTRPKRATKQTKRFQDEQAEAAKKPKNTDKEAEKLKQERWLKRMQENTKKREEEMKKRREEKINSEVFVVSGATGYGEKANGTYKEKNTGYSMVFQQIENPNWVIHRVYRYNRDLTNESDIEDDEFNKIRDYCGWVIGWNAVKDFQCGYVRSTSSPSTSPMSPEDLSWEQLSTTGENPTTGPCDWGRPNTWTNASEPARFEPNANIVVRRATLDEFEAAKAAYAQRQEQLKAVSKVSFNPPAVTVSEPSRSNYGTLVPIPKVRENKRPVYAGISHGQYIELSFVESRRGGIWECSDGDCWIRTPCGFGDALPQDTEHWEYDDGHYASWPIGQVQVTVQADKKAVKKVQDALQKRPEYQDRLKKKK